MRVNRLSNNRARANNAIKLAKKLYVSDNLEGNKGNLGKTWNLINELASRNNGKTSNLLEIKADNKIVSNPVDIAETINEHFTNIARLLEENIPVVDANHEFYLETTDKFFSLETPSIDIVLNLLKEKMMIKKPLVPVLIRFRVTC